VPQGKSIELIFYEWFVAVIATCMLPEVCKKAGLGEHPDPFYTNMCESINKTLKSRTDYKEHELHPFVDKMYAFVESQENVIRKMVIRSVSGKSFSILGHMDKGKETVLYSRASCACSWAAKFAE